MKNEEKNKIKTKFYEDAIKGLMNANNGYITTKMLAEIGIHRMYLNKMMNKKIIERVGNGVYMDINKIEDPYYIFSITTPNAIFSHMTSLYFHGLSIKAPDDKWNITIRKKYHNSKLSDYELFYVNDDIYDLGLIEVKTPMGNIVKAYDIERCICDIIRSKNRMDLELVKYSIRQYLKLNNKDLIKLSEYADKFKIKNEVMTYMEMLYE